MASRHLNSPNDGLGMPASEGRRTQWHHRRVTQFPANLCKPAGSLSKLLELFYFLRENVVGVRGCVCVCACVWPSVRVSGIL